MTEPDRGLEQAGLAARLINEVQARGAWLATAESLTGGLIAAALVGVPGASGAFRGGVVAYATDVKARLLGVEDALLAERGAVDGDVAMAMARGACERLAADWGLASTGYASPAPGADVGLVYVAVHGRQSGSAVRRERFSGDRAAIRQSAVEAALRLAVERVSAG